MNSEIEKIGEVQCNDLVCDGNCRAYDRSQIIKSKFGRFVSIGSDSNIVNCEFKNHIAINRRCYVNDSFIDDYSYMGLNCVVNFSKIGKFCSIGRNVDIGGFNHDYTKVSTMPEFRFKQLFNCGKVELENINEYCEIGNDVWIAAGANILHNVKIGDGAIVGAGAVVTKDVEPYTIVTGIPARPKKKRFEQKYIDKLLEIQWWNFNSEIIEKNIDLFIHKDMNDEIIEKLYMLKEQCK